MTYASTYKTKAFFDDYKGKLFCRFKIITISRDVGRKFGVYTENSKYFNHLKSNKQLALNNALRRAFAAHISKHKIKLKTGNIISLNVSLLNYHVLYVYPSGEGVSLKQKRIKNTFVVVRDKGRFKKFIPYERADYTSFNEDLAIKSLDIDNPFA